MTTIMNLPDEVIVIILKKLSIKDIENFSSTCKKFRETAWGNDLWRQKFNQKWPNLKKIYDRMNNEDRGQINFKIQLKENAQFVKSMWELISLICTANNDILKRFLFSTFFCKNVYSTNDYLIMEQELQNILLHSPWKPNQDLTLRYYSPHFFRLLRHFRIRHKYLKFKNGPKEQQFLERIVTIVVQWFMPSKNISYLRIKQLFDKITRKVLQHLQRECPTHPIFAMDNNYILYWKDNNINHSYWSYTEILPILIIIKEIIFSAKYFSSLNQLWISQPNIPNNYIVTGYQSILLLTVFHSIMRRLGIYSHIMTDTELQIFLKPKVSNDTRKNEYFCLEWENGHFTLRNTIRTDRRREKDRLVIIKELLFYLTNLNTLHRNEQIMLKNMLLGRHIDISDIMVLHVTNIPCKIFSEKRSRKIKYVVGMIVTHKCTHDRTHYGVIVGWNRYYNPSTLGIDFNHNLDSNMFCGNENCSDSSCYVHKPYYAIFCERNMSCYVEQAHVLRYDSPKWIDHNDIGRYFNKFEGNYYIPNKMLAQYYPSDIIKLYQMRCNK